MMISNVLQAAISGCYFLATDVRWVAVAFVCFGLSVAAGELAWLNCVLLFAGPRRVAEYAALHFLLVGVRGVIGPVLGAALLNSGRLGVRDVLFVSVAVQAIGISIMLWVLRTYRSGQTGVYKGD
jgi:hypothetical protein